MDSAELAALHFDKDIVISQAAQGAQGPRQMAFSALVNDVLLTACPGSYLCWCILQGGCLQIHA